MLFLQILGVVLMAVVVVSVITVILFAIKTPPSINQGSTITDRIKYWYQGFNR